MKKSLPTEEINLSLIQVINEKLSEFCFGAYREALIYPVNYSQSKIMGDNSENNFRLSVRIHKNEKGILKSLVFYATADGSQNVAG